jgi:hypothetical protein
LVARETGQRPDLSRRDLMRAVAHTGRATLIANGNVTVNERRFKASVSWRVW